jgi:fluoride exporter
MNLVHIHSALWDRNILLVGFGGFIGSICRFLISALLAAPTSLSFPYGTFLVNLLGCFIIGLIFALSERSNILSPEFRIFLTAGFCGGFTTFSAFSLESIQLAQASNLGVAGLYIGLSIMCGLAATWAAMSLVKAF